MIEFIDFLTIYINGVEQGAYDEAYRNNPDLQGELWGHLVNYIVNLKTANEDLTNQVNSCRNELEQLQGNPNP